MRGNLLNGTLVAQTPTLNLLNSSLKSRNGNVINKKGQIQLYLTGKKYLDTLCSWHSAVSDIVLCNWMMKHSFNMQACSTVYLGISLKFHQCLL